MSELIGKVKSGMTRREAEKVIFFEIILTGVLDGA